MIRDGYFHLNGSFHMNGAGNSYTVLDTDYDRTAEQLLMDTCVPARLNPD